MLLRNIEMSSNYTVVELKMSYTPDDVHLLF
jgi:hypothetical protein